MDDGNKQSSGNQTPSTETVAQDPYDNLVELVNVMNSVDVNHPDAQANATSITDSQGRRIELNTDSTPIINQDQSLKKAVGE